MPRSQSQPKKQLQVEEEQKAQAAYYIFYKEERQNILNTQKDKDGKLENKVINQKIAEKWRSLSKEQKRKYVVLEQKENKEKNMIKQANKQVKTRQQADKQKQEKSLGKMKAIAIKNKDSKEEKLQQTSSQQSGKRGKPPKKKSMDDLIFHEEGIIQDQERRKSSIISVETEPSALKQQKVEEVEEIKKPKTRRGRQLHIAGQDAAEKQKQEKKQIVKGKGKLQQKQAEKKREHEVEEELKEESKNFEFEIEENEEEDSFEETIKNQKQKKRGRDISHSQQKYMISSEKQNVLESSSDSDEEEVENKKRTKQSQVTKKVLKELKQKNPNRTHSTYITFFKQIYGELKKRFPLRSSSDLSKAVSLEWKRVKLISRNQKLKDKIEQKQQQEAEQQLRKTGMELVRRANKDQNQKQKSIKKGWVQIDDDIVELPKKSLSAYLFYYQEKRGEIAQKFSDFKNTDIAIKVGEMWSKLPGQQKMFYQEKSEKDKLRYQKDKKAFSEKYDYAFKEDNLNKNISYNKQQQKQIKRAVRINGEDLLLPKPPLTSYMIYYKEKRPEVLKKNPNLSNTELAKQIAQSWTQASQKIKDKYTNIYEEDKARYEQEKADFSNKYNYKFKLTKKEQQKESRENKLTSIVNYAKKSIQKSQPKISVSKRTPKPMEQSSIFSILNEEIPFEFQK